MAIADDGELRTDMVTLFGTTAQAPIQTWLEDSRWHWMAGAERGTASSRYIARARAAQALNGKAVSR